MIGHLFKDVFVQKVVRAEAANNIALSMVKAVVDGLRKGPVRLLYPSNVFMLPHCLSDDFM